MTGASFAYDTHRSALKSILSATTSQQITVFFAVTTDDRQQMGWCCWEVSHLWNMAVVFDNPTIVRGFESFLGSFPLLDLIVDPEAVMGAAAEVGGRLFPCT